MSRQPSLCPTCEQQVEPSRMARHQRTHRVCPLCGPWTATIADNNSGCPTCGMDPGEVAYRERIMRLGGAEVYRQEWRKAHGLPVDEAA